MIALKLLPVLQLIIVFFSPAYSYPTVYGTKRYGRLQRSSAAQPAWSAPASTHLPYQQLVRTQRYPMSYNYYDMYPGYGQAYPDDYYYPHEAAVTYPAYYYPPARTSKYEVYQAVLPYYYDRPLMRGRYGGGYYGYDDVDPLDVEDDLMQDAEREQREDNQPIGQETYYENDGSDKPTEDLNDVNAAFLQDLIMSQMYKDSLDKSYTGNDDAEDDEVYGKLDTYPPLNHQDYYKEDEEVSELKQLTNNKAYQKQQHDKMKPYKKPQQQKNDFMHEHEPTPEERLHWFQRSAPKKERTNNNFFDEEKRSDGDRKNSLPISDRKSNTKAFMTTAPPSSATTARVARQGQKEEVMLRPATPVKHPFPSHMAVMMSKKDRERDRAPSVYDTIKHMLDMEKSLENGNEELKPQMRKRIVLSEDSLTQQLSVLKKQ